MKSNSYWERSIPSLFKIIVYYHGFGWNRIVNIHIHREIKGNENGYTAKITLEDGE